MSNRMFVRSLVASAALALAACGSAPQPTQRAAGGDPTTGSMQQARHAATSGGETGESCAVEAVYFAYDSSELDGRARSALESTARCLTQRNAAARVTGMTDPRGTEEYNLALGERRARTVTQYLSNLGVDRTRLHSVGEEMASGEDESGWARDRRADIRAE